MSNFEEIVSSEVFKNAKVVGDGEIAWCGTDIVAVLKELSRFRLAVMGVESVTFSDSNAGPRVEAISDCSGELQQWRKNEPWERCVDRALSRSIFDIERCVAKPYCSDVWYVIVEEPE
jgi:hypothetical protein